MTEAEEDVDPADDTDILLFGESMDGKTFEHILSNLNPVIGLLLVGLNRFEEAFPLLKQGFETGREADDREMIFLCGWEIGYILVIDASEPDAAAALPYLTESLAAVTEAEERQYNILEFVVLCLWYLEEQGELAHLADLKSILVLLETGLERARRAGDTDRIAILVYIIGLIHLRVEHSIKRFHILLRVSSFLDLTRNICF